MGSCGLVEVLVVLTRLVRGPPSVGNKECHVLRLQHAWSLNVPGTAAAQARRVLRVPARRGCWRCWARARPRCSWRSLPARGRPAPTSATRWLRWCSARMRGWCTGAGPHATFCLMRRSEQSVSLVEER